MSLNNLRPAKGSNRDKKKIGRGNGSGHGRTSCRGSNGANSRSGSKHYASFEGGQMPLQRRLPKRGFKNFFSSESIPINLGEIEKRLDNCTVVDASFLVSVGLLDSPDANFKVLGKGSFSHQVKFCVPAISKSAEEMIIKAGGSVEIK